VTKLAPVDFAEQFYVRAMITNYAGSVIAPAHRWCDARRQMVWDRRSVRGPSSRSTRVREAVRRQPLTIRGQAQADFC
jgi:hypothetical protein